MSVQRAFIRILATSRTIPACTLKHTVIVAAHQTSTISTSRKCQEKQKIDRHARTHARTHAGLFWDHLLYLHEEGPLRNWTRVIWWCIVPALIAPLCCFCSSFATPPSRRRHRQHHPQPTSPQLRVPAVPSPTPMHAPRLCCQAAATCLCRIGGMFFSVMRGGVERGSGNKNAQMYLKRGRTIHEDRLVKIV